MAGKILEIIEKTLSPEEAQEKTRDNFIQLGKQQYLQGAQLLVDSTVTVSQAVTATSYTELSSFKAGVVSSGGMLEVSASIVVRASGLTTVCGLFVDDETNPRYEVTYGPTSDDRISMALNFKLKLGEGQHVLRLKAYVNTGTATYSETGAGIGKSYMQVTEILGG